MDIPYFAALRAKLDETGAREKLIAENIANATTPGFTPRDVDPASFQSNLRRALGDGGRGVETVTQVRTNALHLAAPNASGSLRFDSAPDSETTADGNQVVLEEQTLKANEARMQFDLAIGLYQKGLQMIGLAARLPSR